MLTKISFVCTIAHETTGITRFRNYTLPNKLNISITICETALTISAATSFFDSVNVKARKFENEALGANNPAKKVEEKTANI